MRVHQQLHNESILQAGSRLPSMLRAKSTNLCSYDQGGDGTGLEDFRKEITLKLRCKGVTGKTTGLGTLR